MRRRVLGGALGAGTPAGTPAFSPRTDRGRYGAALVFRGRPLPGGAFRLRLRFRRTIPLRTICLRIGVFLIRRGARLALLVMRSRTLLTARTLATRGVVLGIVLGFADRLLGLRVGRRLLVGIGDRTPANRLFRVRPCGVLSDGLLGSP